MAVCPYQVMMTLKALPDVSMQPQKCESRQCQMASCDSVAMVTVYDIKLFWAMTASERMIIFHLVKL